MFDFFALPQNMPFSIALVIMIMITVLEVVSASMGAGISDIIDSIIPEMDMDVDIDADLDVPDVSPTAFMKVLSWFRVGEVPVMMLFIIFLTFFGLAGLILQAIVQAIIGTLLPKLLAIFPAIMISIPAVRMLGGIMSKYMPKDETDAVSEKSLIGRVATIVTGTSLPGSPTQAKVKDEHGNSHYILAKPDNLDEIFTKDKKIILISQDGAIYKAIDANSSALTDNN